MGIPSSHGTSPPSPCHAYFPAHMLGFYNSMSMQAPAPRLFPLKHTGNGKQLCAGAPSPSPSPLPGLHICLTVTTPPASATGGHGCRVSMVPTKGRLQRALIQTDRRDSLSNLPTKSYSPSMLVPHGQELQESNEFTNPFLFYTYSKSHSCLCHIVLVVLSNWCLVWISFAKHSMKGKNCFIVNCMYNQGTYVCVYNYKASMHLWKIYVFMYELCLMYVCI